jgi:hypothetical protein
MSLCPKGRFAEVPRAEESSMRLASPSPRGPADGWPRRFFARLRSLRMTCRMGDAPGGCPNRPPVTPSRKAARSPRYPALPHLPRLDTPLVSRIHSMRHDPSPAAERRAGNDMRQAGASPASSMSPCPKGRFAKVRRAGKRQQCIPKAIGVVHRSTWRTTPRSVLPPAPGSAAP